MGNTKKRRCHIALLKSEMVMPRWWNGRHAGLRNRYPKGCESSSLSLGTKYCLTLSDISDWSERVAIEKIYGSVPSMSSKHEKRNWMKMKVRILPESQEIFLGSSVGQSETLLTLGPFIGLHRFESCPGSKEF